MRRPVLIALVFMSMATLSLRAGDAPLNDKIVQFCEQQKGQKVGDGECFALANQALHNAGGTRRFKDNPGKGDYVWGKLIVCMQATGAAPIEEGSLADILPGDIIQFRDTAFKQGRMTYSFGHHTAVIDSLSNHNLDAKILQENFGGKKVVMEMTLHLNDLKKGWIRIYRPVTAAAK